MKVIRTKELAERTGATRRQIDYWAKAGVIEVVGGQPDTGCGFPRLYAEKVVDPVKVLTRISTAFDHHIKVEILKEIYDNYEAGYLDMGGGIYIAWRD